MKKSLTRSKFWLIVSLVVMDSLFFGLTDPHKVASFIIIVGFLLLALTLYVISRGFQVVGSWYGLSLTKRRKKIAIVTAGIMSVAIALQSIGQLGPHDLVVLLPLAIITYFYVSYGRAEQET